jgi:ribose transport system substrate-binding protein
MNRNKKGIFVAVSIAALMTSSIIVLGNSAASAAGACKYLGKATAAVKLASNSSAPWTGPKSGPKASAKKTIYYVAQTQTNGGVAGSEAGVAEAAKAIGWTVKVLDGQGTQQGMDQAMNQAVTP